MSCPACESHRARTRQSGHDSEGRRLRYKACEDCGTRYTTIEVTVPYSLHVLDGHLKQRNRMAERVRRGYHGTKGGPPLKPEPVIDVVVKVRAA